METLLSFNLKQWVSLGLIFAFTTLSLIYIFSLSEEVVFRDIEGGGSKRTTMAIVSVVVAIVALITYVCIFQW